MSNNNSDEQSSGKNSGVKDFVFRKEDLVPIDRDEFIPGATLPADIFLRLTQDKFVLIARVGAKATFHEMRFNENESVDQFYVRRDEYFKCVGQNLTVAGIMVSRAEFSAGKKASFLGKTTDNVFKEIEHLGFNSESMGHAKSVSNSVRTLVESKTDLSNLVEVLNNVNKDLIRHAMATSAIATMLAKNLGWVIPATLEKLSLGGLLHDIGLKEIPKALIDKPRHEMTNEERTVYESHCFRGVEVIRSMPNVPDDVLSIVYEHHENALGLGYPRKLRDTKMNPLAKVIAIADFFSELTFKSPANPTPKTPEEAVRYMETTLGQPFNRLAFEALKLSLTKVNQTGSVKVVA